VIDHEGNRSQQLDIVIHDRQYSPLPLDVKGVIHIPAESVYAVLEVKQSLNADNLEYAGEKVASVRRLTRTAAHFAHAQESSRTAPKEILGGILAFDSDWSPPLGDSLLTSISKPPLLERLNLGCALKHGVFEVTWKDDGTPEVDRSVTEYALVYFFFRLLKRLQQFGMVSVMDYDLWIRCLKS